MSYEKQTWNKYDDLKTEEENIENGAVVTDNRMNHIEEGIEANDKANASQSQSINKHMGDTANPHKVTAAQVGLGNVQNFGLATEDEAKQGDSNAKYMTPSLTQAVLSANINSIAYANSADGTDGFTTVYPNLNLLDGTKDFKPYDGGNNTRDQNAGNIYFTQYKTVADLFKVGDYITISCDVEFLNTELYSSSDDIFMQIQTFGGGWSWLFQVKAKNMNGKFYTRDVFNSSDYIENPTHKLTVSRTIQLTQDFINANATVNRVHLLFHFIPVGANVRATNLKIEQGSTATPYMPSASEVTTADWPKFVGFSNTVKTNKSASDYTWFPVKDSELTNKVESHINNKANPHAVTASQVGAYSKQEIDTKLSKTVMADDSGKVKLTDFEVTTISEKVNIGNGMSLNFQRKGDFVLVRFSGSLTAIDRGTYFSSAVPAQWRPDDIKELIGHFASGALAFHVDLETDGRVKWWGASGATGAPRGTAMYFLK